MDERTHQTIKALAERLKLFIDYRFGSNNAFGRSIGTSGAMINHIVTKQKAFGIDVLFNIFNSHPELNPDWLIWGRGAMIRHTHLKQPSGLKRENIIAGDETSQLFPATPAYKGGSSLSEEVGLQQVINMLDAYIESKISKIADNLNTNRSLPPVEGSRLSDIALCETDGEGRVTYVNDAFTRQTGYSLDEVKGRRPGDMLQGPDTDPETVAQMSKAIKDRMPFEGEILNYHKDGTKLICKLKLGYIWEGGKVVGMHAVAIFTKVHKDESHATPTGAQ
jgi:PAS domain S-box-containing protein